jgi:uncharacterized protein YndB with AHSA1/START domain
MTTTSPNANKSELILKFTRVFDASPDRVFDAWVDKTQLAKWLGPRSSGAQPQTVEVDARVGGQYRIVMRAASGETASAISGVYREVARPSRLVFTWNWDGKGGCSSDPSAAQMPAAGTDTLVTVSFRAVAKGTEMTFQHENFPDTVSRDRHSQGWSGSFDQLAEMLTK